MAHCFNFSWRDFSTIACEIVQNLHPGGSQFSEKWFYRWWLQWQFETSNGHLHKWVRQSLIILYSVSWLYKSLFQNGFFFFLYIYERFQGTTPFKALFVTLFILISDNKKALLEDFLKAFFEQTTFLIFFFFFTFFYMYWRSKKFLDLK